MSWLEIHDGTQRGISQGIYQLLPWVWHTFHIQTECKVKENLFHRPTSRLQKTLDYTTRGRHIVSRSFHSQRIRKIRDILQKCTITPLCFWKKSPLPMYTLSLQIHQPIQPRPSSLDQLIQRGETGSYQPWGVWEYLQKPITRTETGRQDTEGNPLNVGLSSEKWKRQ